MDSPSQAKYPPCQPSDSATLDRMAEFDIRPAVECISENLTTVVYSHNDKLSKLIGSTEFTVFQYSFEVDGKRLNVMWGCDTGLVQINAFFAASETFRKNDPKKAIDKTLGLADVVCCLTGGRLDRQGYWMPYAAAKQMASTFCHRIRYALVPLFGEDFAECCLDPANEGFKSHMVDEATLAECRDQVVQWQVGSSSQPNTTRSRSRSGSRHRHNTSEEGGGPARPSGQIPVPLPELQSGEAESFASVAQHGLSHLNSASVANEGRIFTPHPSPPRNTPQVEREGTISSTKRNSPDLTNPDVDVIQTVAVEIFKLGTLFDQMRAYGRGTLGEIEGALTMLKMVHGRTLTLEEALGLVPLRPAAAPLPP